MLVDTTCKRVLQLSAGASAFATGFQQRVQRLSGNPKFSWHHYVGSCLQSASSSRLWRWPTGRCGNLLLPPSKLQFKLTHCSSHCAPLPRDDCLPITHRTLWSLISVQTLLFSSPSVIAWTLSSGQNSGVGALLLLQAAPTHHATILSHYKLSTKMQLCNCELYPKHVLWYPSNQWLPNLLTIRNWAMILNSLVACEKYLE